MNKIFISLYLIWFLVEFLFIFIFIFKFQQWYTFECYVFNYAIEQIFMVSNHLHLTTLTIFMGFKFVLIKHNHWYHTQSILCISVTKSEGKNEIITYMKLIVRWKKIIIKMRKNFPFSLVWNHLNGRFPSIQSIT